MSGGGGASWADAVKVNVSYDVNKQQELMLNGVVTPIVNHVMTHLNESYTYNTVTPFAVFPSTWTEEIFDQLIADGYAETGWGDSLEWSMKEDTNVPFDEMSHKLMCTFQWVYLPPVSAQRDRGRGERSLSPPQRESLCRVRRHRLWVGRAPRDRRQ